MTWRLEPFYTSSLLLQSFRRLLQCCFAVKLQKCFVDDENFTWRSISMRVSRSWLKLIFGSTTTLKWTLTQSVVNLLDLKQQEKVSNSCSDEQHYFWRLQPLLHAEVLRPSLPMLLVLCCRFPQTLQGSIILAISHESFLFTAQLSERTALMLLFSHWWDVLKAGIIDIFQNYHTDLQLPSALNFTTLLFGSLSFLL